MKNFKVFAEVFDTEINSLNYVKKNLDAKNIDEMREIRHFGSVNDAEETAKI